MSFPEVKNYDEAIEILSKGQIVYKEDILPMTLYRYNKRDIWLWGDSKSVLFLSNSYNTINTIKVGYHPDWPRFGELCLHLRYKMPKSFEKWKENG